ncbi:unnamed protein product [Linum trigynum]|uniref:Uncharacterized protein n=1 Tax=Linum trigynum TaxID=586398 RepID=A0AAV2DXY5_9ROSI
MCTTDTCMEGKRRVDRMVYRYPNRLGGSLLHEELLITTRKEVDVMLEFLNANNISKAEMFVYTEEVEGGGGHFGDGQTSGIHDLVEYMKIISIKVTMIIIPTMSTKKEVEVIINPSHHIKKKPNEATIP